jgi:hypothetical protein
MYSQQEQGSIPQAVTASATAADPHLLAAMDYLQIDCTTLASESPALMRELQARCAACRSKDACAHDLGRSPDGVGSDPWHAYCPNSAALVAIGAMQNCGWAGQYLRRGDRTKLRC